MSVADAIRNLKKDFLPQPLAQRLSVVDSAARGGVEAQASALGGGAGGRGLGLQALICNKSSSGQKGDGSRKGQRDARSGGSGAGAGGECVLLVEDSIGSSRSGYSDSGASEDDDSAVWESWTKATGGSHSWRQKMRTSRRRQGSRTRDDSENSDGADTAETSLSSVCSQEMAASAGEFASCDVAGGGVEVAADAQEVRSSTLS